MYAHQVSVMDIKSVLLFEVVFLRHTLNKKVSVFL